MIVVTRISAWVRRLKKELSALWVAMRDPRTPVPAKIMAALVVSYALSPVDLVPDFIPVVGYLDDIVIVPLGIWLAVRMVPDGLMTEFRRQADDVATLPKSVAGLGMVVLVWLTVVFVFWRWLL